MEEAQDLETKISCAMSARVAYFKEQADSLTLERVRRLLEKDLGLKEFSLDVHKRFIKQSLEKCFCDPDDENVSKNSVENVGDVQSVKEEIIEPCEGLHPQEKVKKTSSEDEEGKNGSAILAGQETTEYETEETQGVKGEKNPSEDTIKKAVKKRAAYFRSHSAEITLVGVRRLLEEDLKLDKHALDAYKSLISEQLDEVLQCPEVVESPKGIKKKLLKKGSHSLGKKENKKGSTKVSRGNECPDSEDSNVNLSGHEEVYEEIAKPKKRTAQKGRAKSTEGIKKRKRSTDSSDSNVNLSGDEEVDEKLTKPKQRTAQKGKAKSTEGLKKHKTSTENGRNKTEEVASEKSNDSEEGGNITEDDHSQSSAEEDVIVKKKKEISSQAYGKRVEQLKSIIKSCGMSIPPTVYKRVKQAPESKREAYLIKELEDILGKEGLSTNPSEKEIKAVRKEKERAKELEGIDMSNIVSSSRRRSTSNFLIPPKPSKPIESDDDNQEDTDDDNDDSDSDDASEGFGEDVEDESD